MLKLFFIAAAKFDGGGGGGCGVEELVVSK
jgi:mevalonate kinase